MLFFKRKKKEEEQDIKKGKKREEKLAKIKEAKKKPSFAPEELRKGKKKKEKPAREVIKEESKPSFAPEELRKGKTKKEEVKTAPKVLSRPQITEKATLLQENNQYIFQVFPHSTKPEVKKAVEEVYGVNVEKVRIVNVQRKKKRLGRSLGWKKGYKKAMVTLRAGQVIEIMPR